jgi:hypothetical protein
VKIKNDQAVFGQDDLFLLENQLPYQLLEDLMELSDKKDNLHKSIDSFIENYANCKNPENDQQHRKAGPSSRSPANKTPFQKS